MQFAVGSYAGDGSDGRKITGLGFQPDLVIIKSEGALYAVFRTSTMPGDATAYFAGDWGFQADRIQALLPDGFELGTHPDVNGSGLTYHWMAFKDNGAGDFKVGSYTGNGSDNRDITGLGFNPDIVCIKGNTSATRGYWRVTANSGDQALEFALYGDGADRIQSFVTDGFQVGTQLNGSSITYYYFAFKVMAGCIAQGSYTGNGSDNRSITGLGFQPDLVWIKGSSVDFPVHRPSSLAGDSSLFFQSTAAAADHIQALQTDGFQVGTLQNVSGRVYRWFAWKAGITGDPLGAMEIAALIRRRRR